ncbi:MAG TPA: DinB family protein [Acidimicrobiales bacterium]|nr:DinB family protein [Acidimicrobiales bacterium]
MSERHEPEWVDGERATLLGWLDYHRATLALKCEGLSSEQLGLRSAPPSSISLIGLVRHMTDVERGWFRQVFEAETDLPDHYSYERGGFDQAFDSIDPDDAPASMAAWIAECDVSRAIVDRHSLDDVSTTPHRGKSIGLRWIVTHMIEEYARHNGHADILRERIDGAVGD